MRRCCCCIPILPGATILGVLAIAIAVLELVPLVPYIFGMEGFNPIEKHLNHFFYMLEDLLQSQNFTKPEIDDIHTAAREALWPALLGDAISALVYCLVALLMIFGIQCDVRGLMLPYLFLQLLFLIIAILAGLAVTVFLFMYNFIMGIVGALVLLITSFVLFYLWVAVQRAYVELGSRDFMYSPAPTKPTYHPQQSSYNNVGGGMYPTAPQHFQMQDKC